MNLVESHIHGNKLSFLHFLCSVGFFYMLVQNMVEIVEYAYLTY